MSIARLWKENKLFILFYSLIVVATGSFLAIYDKSHIHLAINSVHCAFGDYFFRYITHLGDGWFTMVIVFILLFISYRKSLFVLGSFLAGGLVVQVMKRLIFSDLERPIRYFKEIAELQLVEGVTLHGAYSFPSGHTASAFSLFFCLAVFVKNPLAKILFLILAVLVAFSRVYLSQHFLGDVLAGSLIGVLVVIPFYYWLHHGKQPLLNRSLPISFKHNRTDK